VGADSMTSTIATTAHNTMVLPSGSIIGARP
jgi:hypothetical protein